MTAMVVIVIMCDSCRHATAQLAGCLTVPSDFELDQQLPPVPGQLADRLALPAQNVHLHRACKGDVTHAFLPPYRHSCALQTSDNRSQLLSPGQTILPTQANSSQVTKSNLASAGGKTIPPSWDSLCKKPFNCLNTTA